jgi:hypothetical protein
MLFEGNEDEDSESVNGGDGISTNGQGDAAADSAAQMSAMVETPIDDVDIIGTLGYGHNGVWARLLVRHQ